MEMEVDQSYRFDDDDNDSEGEEGVNNKAVPEALKTQIRCPQCDSLLELIYTTCEGCFLGDNRMYKCSECYFCKRVRCPCYRCSLCQLYSEMCNCTQ